ncbi:MBL fold metallo-hydrolase [Sphingomonadales bacterium 56]|uniref:MBL fold metallo-hydrolase n=4 Tax=Sphingomonadaceae TaxID=41297 RepID=A0A2S8B0B0_9SPHN|nr:MULTISPECIES: MBL fold metallo-hydrolase [Sphingomonadaceae]EPR12421.1 hydrolase [Sphingobium indicum IP26]KEY99739.1 hydrolase [Sphingomonas sp. BHC-A]MBY2930666.1 MBL fold metallo-hydrolase [Sphingomonadales bacterium 56]MBY2960658.1 MBL fold metallo-hydrolase [Sphingomonadales bacterium 58]PQM25719.1 MBL fold metallo-hydrolase [Sphingopyxis lindanitolerans]
MKHLLPILIFALAGTVAARAETPPAQPPRLILLGTAGGPIARLERSQPANAIVVGGQTYLIDAGDGLLRQMAASKLGLGSVKALFLTHHHIDHVADVPVLMIDRWLLANAPPLEIYGPPGSAQLVAGTLAAFRPVELAPVTVGGPVKPPLAGSAVGHDLPLDLNEPRLVYKDDRVRVFAIGVDHYHYPAGSIEARSSRSYAYRVEAGGKVYVFSGDTGPSERLKILAKDADYLVCEVIDIARMEKLLRSYPGFSADQIPPLMEHMREDHLTGEQIGEIAAAAGVKKVILTHFAPGNDGETDVESYAAGISRHFHGEVAHGRDLDQY